MLPAKTQFDMTARSPWWSNGVPRLPVKIQLSAINSVADIVRTALPILFLNWQSYKLRLSPQKSITSRERDELLKKVQLRIVSLELE